MNATQTAESVFTHHALLILDNEEGYYNDLCDLAREHDDDETTWELARAIKDYIEEIIPEEYYQYNTCPMLAELLTLALAYVDYDDIARHYRQTVREG